MNAVYTLETLEVDFREFVICGGPTQRRRYQEEIFFSRSDKDLRTLKRLA